MTVAPTRCRSLGPIARWSAVLHQVDEVLAFNRQGPARVHSISLDPRCEPNGYLGIWRALAPLEGPALVTDEPAHCDRHLIECVEPRVAERGHVGEKHGPFNRHGARVGPDGLRRHSGPLILEDPFI